jgi:hypothetical protein
MKLNLLAVIGLMFLAGVIGSGSFAAQKISLDAKQNGKNKLGTGYYFTYSFTQRPSIGTNILKIQIFDNKGNKNSSFDLKGTSDMAEMRGMGSDEQVFKKNKKNDYLLPVDVSMRGGWVVAVKFLLNKAEYARYNIKFNI